MSISKQNIAKSFSKVAANYEANAFLQKEVADRLLERLLLMNSHPSVVLDAGCSTGYCARVLKERFPKAQLFGVDLAQGMINKANKTQKRFKKIYYQVADMEKLPFQSNTFDLVLSNLAIPWIENPSNALQELNRVLKPKGLVIFSTVGPDTLIELKQSWEKVDQNIHVNQFMDMHLIGDMVHKTGFENTVMDRDVITLTYKTLKGLMRELKLIGANNLNSGRVKGLLGRNKFNQLAQAYEILRREDGQLPVTCEVIYGHAWKREEKVKDYHSYDIDL